MPPDTTPPDTLTTRERLLAAARAEFTAHGIAGGRVDRIAAEAGANKERLYAHFGSKEQLFQAVVLNVIDEHIAAIGMPSGDPAEFVGRVYDFHRDHPDLLRLLQWEMLYYGHEPLPGEDRRIAHYAAKVDALARSLGGEPDREMAANLLMLIGLAAWPYLMPQVTRLILGPEYADTPAADRLVRDRVMTFARETLGRPDP